MITKWCVPLNKCNPVQSKAWFAETINASKNVWKPTLFRVNSTLNGVKYYLVDMGIKQQHSQHRLRYGSHVFNDFDFLDSSGGVGWISLRCWGRRDKRPTFSLEHSSPLWPTYWYLAADRIHETSQGKLPGTHCDVTIRGRIKTRRYGPFVLGIHRSPVDSQHNRPITRREL